MVNLEPLEITLKSKWLKQIPAIEGDWMTIPKNYGIDKIPQYGQDYLGFLLAKIKNPFWRSFINAISMFKTIYDKNIFKESSLNEPLWFNPDT